MAEQSKNQKSNTEHKEVNDLHRQPYQYVPLPTKTSFRVLELLAGHELDAVSFRLHLADWTNPPQYEAISYVWGDTGIKVPAICDDHLLQVTPSLRDGLCKMRYLDCSRYLWADAACIDQSKWDEKGWQVSNMQKIYNSATKVVVWLGQDEESQAERAIAAMHEISLACCENSQISPDDVEKLDSFGPLMPAYSFTGLQCDNSSSWQSLAWFFSRPWFSRLWVFQEVNSGTDAYVLCGNFTVNWHVVALVAMYIFSFQHISHAWGFPQSYYWNAFIMRQRRWLQRATIPDLLNRLRLFDSTHELDRVYALLGMPAFAKMNPPWEADYRKSRLDVYREVATRCILELKSLSVLSRIQHGLELQEDFPSWIPQWDQAPGRNVILNPLNFEWKACGDTCVTAEVDDSSSKLTIAGIAFDIVDTEAKMEAMKWFDSENNVLENHPVIIMQNDAKSMDYPTGERLTDVYAIVTTGGRGYGSKKEVDKRREFFANFAAYVLRLLELAKQDVKKYNALEQQAHSGSWADYETAAREMSWNRSFFTTKKGYCGLGPNTLRSGDIVCVLHGGAVPFILRPKNELYQLIGEAYVHGIMEGEAISQWKNGDLEQTTFVIT